jgi:hypothetical protein
MSDCNTNSYTTPGCSVGVTEGGCMNSKNRFSCGNGGFPYAMAPSPATPAKPVVEGYGGGGGAGPPSMRAAVRPWYMSDTPTIGVL